MCVRVYFAYWMNRWAVAGLRRRDLAGVLPPHQLRHGQGTWLLAAELLLFAARCFDAYTRLIEEWRGGCALLLTLSMHCFVIRFCGHVV